MKMVKFYAIVFTGLGIAFIWKGAHSGTWAFAWVWIGISLILVGSGYGGVGPRVFGKLSDGTMSPIAIAVLLPFLLGTWTVWHLRRWISNGPAGQEIISGICLGRRPYFRELPPGIGLVIDLAAELPADPVLTRRVRYVSVPVLDGSAPPDGVFMNLVERVLAETEPVFVHCAVGHARSASVVAGVLIRKSLASDVDSAEALIRQKRPGVRLNRLQRQQVQRLIVPKIGDARPEPQR
jgi:hypothetical protein